ncbi:hypothetical protein H112_02206 [Trichophyton rubrum D6]|uniref:TPR domain-containing protein n=3 Tax=Trichophyton TaxID=5550 RepID=F2SVB8_TRIRC|nr:uncharacterized protein TERG_06967 [Trichophyton rubrum CBS 118892]EZF25475.1 hypothetical protein H100_02206 [Trichophyton rubrum MR850]EZF44516.1 hypothetical protein H102_02202 [Trichophyton rubrum CBS 100081]EZF55154.1 hypothetical protein H103_02211 [Trichophyton rubrum CBS 288.86]EZF65772.1 hypothetical protein H104_02187 [Trichophyton rubrum CBS 289.86]EZF76401.1 hypothetical protein H105_02223 [Trichophyton soudanense CBS 452.61]EZF87080.1 hypothetical protein H110_02208 [Trichophy
MPKPKTLLKETKAKKKRKQVAPESADEFLAEGVDLEEAGEKWRAGDPVKSMRFFMRAIEMYETGLRRYPASFDLAYNKARVQYEITQHPKLVTQLPGPIIDILRIALDSHREALQKDQDNADILFNTAQVLTSVAEALTEGKHADEEQTEEALKCLTEALELFQRCLVLQELRFTEFEQQLQMVQNSGPDHQTQHNKQDEQQQQQQQQTQGDVGDSRTGSTEAEEWAAVVEPVTKNTLIDTAIAQLEALATLCGLLSSDHGSTLVWVEEYSSDLLREKIAAYVEGTDRANEVAMVRAKFLSILLEINYRSGRIDLDTYKQELDAAWSNNVDVSHDPAGLSNQAEALIGFSSAIADAYPTIDVERFPWSLDLRWQALGVALSRLAAASKLAGPDNLAKIHIARGDAEMHRWRLGQVPFCYAPAVDNAATLLKNAETYYRGGAATARRDGWPEAEREGTVKEALAKGLAGDSSQMRSLAIDSKGYMMRVANDMAEDGHIPPEDLTRLMAVLDPNELLF